MNDNFHKTITIELRNYEAIVLQQFLIDLDEAEIVQNPIERQALWDLEALIEREIFRGCGVPDIPQEEIIPTAYKILDSTFSDD